MRRAGPHRSLRLRACGGRPLLRSRSASILGACPNSQGDDHWASALQVLWPLVPREAIGTLLQWVTAPSPGAREWLPPSPDATWGNQLLREGKEAVGSGGILRPVLDLSPLGSAPAQDVFQTATGGPWLDSVSIAEALIAR